MTLVLLMFIFVVRSLNAMDSVSCSDDSNNMYRRKSFDTRQLRNPQTNLRPLRRIDHLVRNRPKTEPRLSKNEKKDTDSKRKKLIAPLPPKLRNSYWFGVDANGEIILKYRGPIGTTSKKKW